MSPGGIAAHFAFVSIQRSICRVGIGPYETSTFDNYIPKINECRMQRVGLVLQLRSVASYFLPGNSRAPCVETIRS